MTDPTPTPDPNPDAGHSPEVAAAATPEAHIAANVDTAVAMHRDLGHTVEAAAAWLHKQLDGLIADVESCVAAIKAKL